MWVVQHLFMAGLTGLIMFVGIAVAERLENFNVKRLVALFASLAAPNLIDLDHYGGSWSAMFKCAFVTSMEQFHKTCTQISVRGIFHQPIFFIPLIAVLGISSIYAYKKGLKLDSTILMGLWVGYVLHLCLDGILFFTLPPGAG